MYMDMTEILHETTYLYQAFKKSFRSCQLSTDSFEYISQKFWNKKNIDLVTPWSFYREIVNEFFRQVWLTLTVITQRDYFIFWKVTNESVKVYLSHAIREERKKLKRCCCFWTMLWCTKAALLWLLSIILVSKYWSEQPFRPQDLN